MTNTNDTAWLVSGAVVTRNTFLNLIGQGAPLLLAIFVIPILIKELGTDRFGVLTLAWMVIGYFSLFDLGIGRALTKIVAEKLGAGQKEEVPALVWTSLFLMLILGVVGALVVGLLSPWLVHRLLKVPVALQPETLSTFYVLAMCTPLVIITIGLRGILEAFQYFGFISAMRIALGIATFLSPLVVLPFSQSLFLIVAALAAFRLLAFLAYLLYCLYVLPPLRHSVIIRCAMMRTLLSFGGWITISNIISPIMVYLDRFLIGALISMTAVAYYVTPYEVVTKLSLISSAMVQVLFPAFALSFVQDPSRTGLLFRRGVKFVFLILFPITLLVLSLGQEGLEIWLGKEFAKHSTRVLQWLALGVFINSLARIPFGLIQSVGRPDLTALVHLVELPFYLIAVWWMTSAYGIEGTAIVWLGRTVVDAGFMFGIASWLLPACKTFIWRMVMILGGSLLATAFAMLPMSFTMNKIFLFMILSIFVFVAWFLIFSSDERNMLKKRFKSVFVYPF